jgi:cytochrome c oxidase assembly factor CtaG
VTFFVGLGLGSILLTSCSFLGVYSDSLFWVRAIDVVCLLTVTPLCLAIGAPFTLFNVRVSTGRLARIVTHPATASGLLIATPWLLYFTGWYETALRHEGIDYLTRLWLLAVGFNYFYSRLQIDPVPRKYSHLITVWLTFAETIFDGVLGLVLWMGGHVVAADLYSLRSWGPDVRTDQIIGAGILWIGADAAGLPFLGAIFKRMTSDDEARAAQIDAELDQAEQAPTKLSPTTPSPPTNGLWWESDTQLSNRFKRP